jgi:AcrR family transcriptional regulator
MNNVEPVPQQPQPHQPQQPQQQPVQAEAKPADAGATPRTVDWNNPRVSAILEAAAKCFARKGFSATTLAEIGKELGLRKSIVHYYFASKAALIHEVQSYTNHKYLERVKGAVDSDGERGAGAMRSLWSAT